MARKLTMEDSALRKRKNAERRALIAAGKLPKMGAAMVKVTGLMVGLLLAFDADLKTCDQVIQSRRGGEQSNG